MPVVILFGTETGTAEFVAYELADQLSDHQAEVTDMADFELDSFTPEDFYVLVCSTHEDGELPESAQPFFDRLTETSPDLTGIRYAMFGMGDSIYVDTFNFGGVAIDNRLTELGAERVGAMGTHDASSRDSASDMAQAWLESVLPLIE